MWECLFDFGEVSVAEGGTGNLCGVQYHSQADVLKHYANAHLPVELVEPSKWFHCRTCGQWNDVAWDCLQCEMVDFGAQEEWLCGFAVSKRPAVTERQMTVTEEVEGPTEIDEVGMAYSTIYWSGISPGRGVSGSQDGLDAFEERLREWAVSMKVGLPPQLTEPC